VPETDLYPPVKAYLEAQGYEVKGEVGRCDLVALRDGDEPVIVELKASFGLPLVFQGIDRQAISDWVYLAVPGEARGARRRRWRDRLKLCRRLGLGLIVVGRLVEVLLDPAPYRPRRSKRRRSMLLREFARRVGDPNSGGSSRRPLMTAYRQDALRCARYLKQEGPSRIAVLRTATGVEAAATILQRDVYGWFQRVARGTYALTPVGERALETWADEVEKLG
jgi:hypothetical protein